jgi:predicted dehydrogenase
MSAAHARILVVGLGSIGRRHARLLSERDDVILTICDSVAESRRETHGELARPASETADVHAALAAGQDAVIIATPNVSHLPIGLEAVAAGADLLVEKPLAVDVAAAATLAEASRHAGRFLQVGYMLRYDEGLARLKTWVDEGALGALVGGRAMVGTYVTLLNAKSPFRLSEPNALVSDYTHELDFLRWLFGPAAAVAAAGTSLGARDLRPEPNVFQLCLRMRSGALVQVHMDYVQFPQRRTLELYGDRATATYDFMTGEIRRFAHGREHRWEHHDVVPIVDRWDDLFRREHESFLAARRNGAVPVVGGEDGVAALALAEAAVTAAETGRWIELPPETVG